jgi:hypothetical protein
MYCYDSNDRAMPQRSEGFRASLPVPCQALRFLPKVVAKSMIARGFSARGEPQINFSLSFPTRQGTGEAVLPRLVRLRRRTDLAAAGSNRSAILVRQYG